MAAGAPRTVFIFTPDELPGYDLGALPARLRSATFFLLDERHVYTTADRAIHVPHVRDGRTAEGRAARWLEHVQQRLPVHVWLALGWDRGYLSGGFLKGHFDARRPATVRKAFTGKRFTCLGPEILATTDPARLAIPPASMALLGADGYFVEMVGGDGASGHIEERWFSSDVETLWTELRRFYASPWDDHWLRVFQTSRRVLAEVRGGVVRRTWDLAEHETFVSTARRVTGSIAAPSSVIAQSTRFQAVRAGQRVLIRLPDGEALIMPATARE
jgi:hypothetical protein